MADLARKLCEAVENEDAKEVENLLNCGADPNLVLSDGIAAIHLASGKESESALRCLTMILQQGGDPNVRSIEELTPVHVAASWGCCKALIFLLRKGGNPSIEDQDGNTALDLALMEKNRRCVVALQEYNERSEHICLDQMRDYYKEKSCEPDEIPEMSSISLLLESTYEVSPYSSTKISPFISAPKNRAIGKGADNAVLASQTELSFDARNRTGKCNQKFADLERSKLHLNDKITNNTRSCNSESEFINQNLNLQNWHDSKNYSSHLYPDIVVRNCSSNIKYSVAHADLNSGEIINSQNQAKGSSLNVHSQANLESNKIGNIHANSPSSKSTELQFVLKTYEGLDVTSPDHVYTYNRGYIDHDMEETLVLPRTDDIPEDKGLVSQEISSSSKYTSCFSDGFTTLMESSSASKKEGLISNVDRESLLDSNRNQMYSQNSGNVDTQTNSDVCSVMNLVDSVQGAVNTLKKQVEGMDNEELGNISAQGVNCKSSVLSSQNLMSSGNECRTTRTTETLCTSQSPTLPAADTNAHESCSSDLGMRLRDLMLSSKMSGLVLKQQGNHSLPGLEPGGKFSSSSTISMSSEILPPIGKSLKDTSSTCLNTFIDTLIVESADCENRNADDELCDLKKIMLATKVIHPVSSIPSEEKSPCFFNERTRSRLLSAKSRHSNSSLFDESLEMPQRGRRLRSPDGRSGSPVPSAEVRKTFDQNGMVFQSGHTLETWVPQNNICLGQTPKDHKENVSESETTVSISNFLTDDLSSEAEVKSNVKLRKTSGNIYIESRVVPESVWLTEDGDTKSSDESNHKYVALDSSKQGKTLSAAPQTGSFFHSTLIEDPAGISTKVPRYSFSRLSGVPRADETEINETTLPDPVIEEVHLSPGGRPVNITHFEPVEYLYMDNEKGHALVEKHIPCTNQSVSEISESSDDTIIYDWRNYSNCKEKIKEDSPALTPTRVAVELYRLSNDEIARRLRGLGEEPGQVNSQTRKVCILLLDKRLKEQVASGPGGLSFDYSPELSLALRTYDIPDCNNDEAALSREFDQPDKTRKWREGVLKSSFNYLLLDPRVTRNLPSRFHTLSPPECFRTFVRAVFYVGKGKRARPYCHLYESLTHHKGSNKQPCSKVQHILDIWRSGQGVLSLHCFQNTIPVEAYTREACMVDAIGLKMLTNQKKGVYYGQAQNWTPTRRRRLGVHMLHRAMQIFLAEGERQLRPPDIRTGT